MGVYDVEWGDMGLASNGSNGSGSSDNGSNGSGSSDNGSAVTSSGGWGMLDTIAAISQGNTTALSHAQSMSQTNDDFWGHNTAQTAVNNAINQGASEGGWNANEEQVAVTGEPFVKDEKDTTTDGGVVVPKIVTDKKKKIFTIPGLPMKVDKRLHNLYQSLLSRGYEPKDARKIIELGLTEEQWADENLVDLKSGEGIKRLLTKTIPDEDKYEHEFLGSAGAAAILNKINKAGTEGEKQKIMHDAMAADPEGFKKMFSKIGDPNLKQFKDTLVNLNEGNKNFDKNYHETAGAYWELHPPQTSGAMEDMANAYQQGNLEMTKQNTLAIQNAVDAKSKGQGLASLGGGGGGGGGTQPVDPADPDAGLMPSGTYLASQYNQALVPDPNLDPYQNAMYTGGPEQQHLAGGYWDPDKQEWVGSPWGTQNLWQGANPPTTGVVGLAEGGPVRAPSSKVTIGGGGLFDFKPYGF